MFRILSFLMIAASLCFTSSAFGVTRHLKATVKNASSNLCISVTAANTQQATLKPNESWEVATATGLALVYKSFNTDSGCATQIIGAGSVQVQLPPDSSKGTVSVFTSGPGIVIAGNANAKPFLVTNRETQTMNVMGDNAVVNLTISKP